MQDTTFLEYIKDTVGKGVGTRRETSRDEHCSSEEAEHEQRETRCDDCSYKGCAGAWEGRAKS
ncbi:MAG: hypothetical protein HY267_02910 [Deltaproteobacteria bacterium]|nr:hypothetical protein [Deltaproteobacteria bacterium]